MGTTSLQPIQVVEWATLVKVPSSKHAFGRDNHLVQHGQKF